VKTNLQITRTAIISFCACLIIGPHALAITPDLSTWQRCLSYGETTNVIQSEYNQEIVAVGNTLHMVWVANAQPDYWHSGPTNRLYYRRSLDAGRTWQPAVLLDESDLMVLRDGGPQRWLAVDGTTVHVASVRSTSGGDWYYMLDYFRSTDNGASFAARQTFRAPENVWHIGNVFVTAAEGKVNLFYRYNPNWYTRGLIACRSSSDGGGTFSLSYVIDTPEAVDLYDVRQQAQDLVLVWTTGAGIPGSYSWYSDLNVAVSTDWGQAYAISHKLNGNASDGYGHVDSLNDYHEKPDCVKAGSNVYVAWTGLYTNDVRNVFFARSLDKGASFEPLVNLSNLLPPGTRPPQYGHASIAARGACVYVVCTMDNAQVFYWASTDNGATFQVAELTSATTQSTSGGWWPLVMVDPQSLDGRKVHFFCTPDLYWTSTDAGTTLVGGLHHSFYYSWAANNPNNPQWTIGADGAVHLTLSGAIGQWSENYLYYDREVWHRRLEPAVTSPSARNASLSLWGNRDQTRYDCLQVPFAADLAFSNTFTVEAWVRFAAGAGNNTVVLFQENAAHYMGGIVLATHEWAGTRRPNARVKTATGFYELWGGEILADGVWNHLAFSYDADAGTNNARLYVNGHLSVTVTATGLVPPNRGEFWVGKSRSTYEVFIGQVDDIRLWNRALSELEIHDRLGSPRAGTEPGLVAYLPLNDSTRDVSGRGHDGVLMYRETYDTGFFAVPVFTSAPMTGGVLGRPFVWKAIADYATGMTATGLPKGLVLDGATGFITGTPTVSGVFDTEILATNFQHSTKQTLRLVINDNQGILFRDDFNGSFGSGWDALWADPQYYSFLPGLLDLRANNAETYGNYNRPLNLFGFTNHFAGDYMLTLGIARYAPTDYNWNRICLTAFDDYDNAIRFAYGYGNGRQFEILGEQLQTPVGWGTTADLGTQPFLLRLVKQGGGAGDLYTALFSTNGVDFLPFANNTLAHGDGVPTLLGFWMGIDGSEQNHALVDYFEVSALPTPEMQMLADDFSTGSNAPSWRSQELFTPYFAARTGGAFAVSKPDGGTGGSTDWATYHSAGTAVGDFDVKVDYRDAVLTTGTGGWGNQVQLNCWIGDIVFCIVRGNEPSLGGQNAHIWSAGNYGVVAVTNLSGTLRIIRTGNIIKGYHDDRFLWQRECPTTPATFAVSLQNNGTTDPISVKFDNFVLSAQQVMLAQPVFTSARMTGGMVGAPFVFQVSANYASSLKAIDLPAGLSLNPEGLITGTPTRSGVFDVQLTAANAQASATQVLRILARGAAGVVFRDDFSTGLAAGWNQVPADTSFYSVEHGLLKLRANYGDTWAWYNRPLNLFSVNNSATGNLVVQMGISRFEPSLRDSPGIFLVGWDDTDNNVRYSYTGGYNGPSLGLATEAQQVMASKGSAMNFGVEPFVMRLAKEGNVYTASWSTNGIDFNPVQEASLPFGDGTPAQAGFWMGLDSQLKDIMLVDYFEVVAVPTPGTFDRWAFDNNLGGADAALTGNPSGDGVQNIFKYAFGVPASASAEGKLPTHSSDATHLVLTFRQLAGGNGVVGVDYAAGGLVYTVQVTEAIGSAWLSGAAVAEFVPGSRVLNGDGTETVSVRVKLPTGTGSKFVRLALRPAGN
jgi:hypothetical protein